MTYSVRLDAANDPALLSAMLEDAARLPPLAARAREPLTVELARHGLVAGESTRTGQPWKHRAGDVEGLASALAVGDLVKHDPQEPSGEHAGERSADV